MIDIFNIPLYYIGFKKNQTLENHLLNKGFKNVNHFSAIDGRKLDLTELLKKNIISIRGYTDIKYGRSEHVGISSMGTIGCTLSHRELWKMCSEKMPYMIIAEEDVKVNKISNKDILHIQNSLQKKNGVYVCTNIPKSHSDRLVGLHLYFISNDAAKILYQNSTPIDVQTDYYIGHLNNVGFINIDGNPIAYQEKNNNSTTTDTNKCFKCILPKHWLFYVTILISILVIIIIAIMFFIKFKTTKYQLDSCRSSSESIMI